MEVDMMEVRGGKGGEGTRGEAKEEESRHRERAGERGE